MYMYGCHSLVPRLSSPRFYLTAIFSMAVSYNLDGYKARCSSICFVYYHLGIHEKEKVPLETMESVVLSEKVEEHEEEKKDLQGTYDLP